MMDYHRKRHPEDVPTPVAVAVSDYCRRARAPASPGLVRDALALLDESDDFRVRELTDTEPTRRLGPFAVVDVIIGTDAETAEQREQTGYYEMVRKVAEENARKAPPPPAAQVPVLTASAPRYTEPREGGEPAPSTPRPRKSKGETIKERIAPQKRKAGERDERPVLPRALPGTAFLPKRNLPAPRGRFTTVDPTRASFESLFRPEARETLSTLIEQVPHRVALLRTLEQGYQGRRGTQLSVGDVEDLLEAHELFEIIEQKERTGVLAAVLEQKGSLGRAAHAFGLGAEELEKLIGALGLEREVDEIREKFIKEALAPANLPLRLDLLFRSRYLEDLRIDRRFTQGLKKQLEELIDEVADAATDVPTLVDMLSRQHALHAESLRRALEKLGLLEPWLKDLR
ncbi:MAG: hypothetical protein ACOZQL_21955 [Myxococcota bacterium]